MNYSILLVDDEPLIIEGLKILVRTNLSSVGKVHVAYSGSEGIEAALEFMPDVIITDIMMNDMDGLEMIRILKDKGFRSHFIIISGYEEFEYARTAIALGVDEYLTKPVEEEALVKAWEKVTGKISDEDSSCSMSLDECLSKLEGDHPSFDISSLITNKTLGDIEIAIGFADESTCRDIVDKVFHLISDKNLSYEEAKLVAVRLVVHCFRRFNVQTDDGQHSMDLRSMDRICSVNRLRIWTMNVISNLAKTRIEIQKDSPDLVTEVKKYIVMNSRNDISLTDIADRFNINPTYFSGLFKKKTGMTYIRYLAMVRMQKAKRLLDVTDKKIYEVCESVGYSDVNHFNRMFKREFGMTPFEYRKKNEHRNMEEQGNGGN